LGVNCQERNHDYKKSIFLLTFATFVVLAAQTRVRCGQLPGRPIIVASGDLGLSLTVDRDGG
jgi:hypothetical protein